MGLLNKIKSIPQGAKASIAFFLASLITSGISYITTPLYTRLLSPEEYGQVSVYLTWMQVFGIIAMFCLAYGVFNNGMVDYPEKRDEYSFSMLVLSNIITLCFSGVILCLYPLVKEWLGMDLPLLILMLAVFMVRPAYNFWSAKQRYELKYKWTVFWSVSSAIFSPLVAILLMLFTDGNRLYARIFGAEVALIVIYIVFYIYLAIKAKGKINTKYWKAALLFNLPLIPHYLSTYLLGSSDKLMISAIVSDAATAYYSVAYAVASVVTIVWSAINSSMIPFTYENCRKNNYGAIAKVTTPILALFAVACCSAIMLAPEVVAIMATADYMEAIYVIPPIVGGVFFQVHYNIYANVVYYYKKPKYIMFASVMGTLLNIGLNYVFISRYGYLAAGYTTLVCYLVQAAFDYFAMKKVVKENVYDMRGIGVLSAVVIVVSLLSNLVYEMPFVRYGIILAVLIIAFVFRKKIISLFKEMKNK